MDSTKITEGVGKKIVEALKQQSDIEIIPVNEENNGEQELTNISTLAEKEESPMEEISVQNDTFEEVNKNISSFNFNDMDNTVDNALNNTLMNFKNNNVEDINISAAEELELPQNVAVLRKLITKLPVNVSKQTGALIIKQTMEALGISMTSVLQEAQQVQENLTQSVKECQTNVLEYKKQINILEVQTQKYQRQFAAINDIISLFIQTN